MLVLGIDPGLSRCGYGVLETAGAARAGGSGGAEAVAAGVLRTSPDVATPQRLATLQHEIAALVDEFSPAAVAVERVFFSANVRTAIGVAMAAGLALAAGAAAGAEVAEYTPNQVKIAVAGWGAAPKDQVQRMVQTLLGLPDVLKPADAADAAAVALCHIAHCGLLRAAAAGTTAGATGGAGSAPRAAAAAVSP
ncbi:MAG TPA: crossover junction endodeoxyribonuclease RuvC [Acidimicrobiaceae bacterium]|nr:crossover junction endodeoxyribonuclease RuvC [Acidimicrobiaceae bacterium]